MPELSFRDAVGRYSRVYGKNNCDERHPLHYRATEKAEKACSALLKLFDAYAPLKETEAEAQHSEAELAAYKKAQSLQFIAKITKRDYVKNEKEIRNLSNQIEEYLKKLLSNSKDGILEIKRSDLAEIFMCVPSQINYVLSTRFSPNQGYMVESRRGGGGFVRIIKLSMDNETNLTAMLETAGQRKVSRQVGEKLVDRLLEEDFLTSREGMIIKSMINDKLLGSDEKADALRGDMLNAVLLLLLRDDFV